MKEKHFSVITTVFNTEISYLCKSADSTLGQLRENDEYIIIDDGSFKNESSRYCDELANIDHRVIVVHQNNTGVSTARNKGNQIATGEYLTHIDSDDWVDSSAFQYAYEKGKQYKADIVLWNACIVRGDNYLYSSWLPENLSDELITYDTKRMLQRQMLFCGYENEYIPVGNIQCGGTWAKMYRREFLMQNEIEYPSALSIYEDCIMNIRAFEKAERVIYIKDIFYYYRIAERSLSRVINWNITERYLNSFRTLKSVVQEINSPDVPIELLYLKIQKMSSVLLGTFFLNPMIGASYKKRKKLFLNFLSEDIMQEAWNSFYRDNLSKGEAHRRQWIRDKRFLLLYLKYGRANWSLRKVYGFIIAKD